MKTKLNKSLFEERFDVFFFLNASLMNIPNLYGQVRWTPTELSRSKKSFLTILVTLLIIN